MGITVVKDVTWDDELMKGYVLACARTNEGADCVSMNRELFGPILPIVPVDSISTAIDRLKGTTPLAVYIFSQSNKFIDWVRRSTTSGSVLVNDLMVQFTIDGLPFGGVGESGQGNYHGKRSFDVFTHERSSLSSPYWYVLHPNILLARADVIIGAGRILCSQYDITHTRTQISNR